MFWRGLKALVLAPRLSRKPYGVTTYWFGKNAGCVVFIFVGVVLHHLYRGTWKLRLGVPLILTLLGLYALCCYRGATGRDIESTMFFRAAVVALVAFVPLLLANHWLPYSRWIDRIANISYPLYLVHGTLGYIIIRAVYLESGSLYLGFACAFAVAAALSALLHCFVEQPSIELGRRLAARLRTDETIPGEHRSVIPPAEERFGERRFIAAFLRPQETPARYTSDGGYRSPPAEGGNTVRGEGGCGHFAQKLAQN
jgi:peptidoglycan/LPS O-acetylase OafA/YrhL